MIYILLHQGWRKTGFLKFLGFLVRRPNTKVQPKSTRRTPIPLTKDESPVSEDEIDEYQTLLLKFVHL